MERVYRPEVLYSNTGRVEYDNADYESVESEGTYAEIGSVQTVVEKGDYYRSRDVVATTLYLHVESGLVVADVGMFEEWLRGLKK